MEEKKFFIEVGSLYLKFDHDKRLKFGNLITDILYDEIYDQQDYNNFLELLTQEDKIRFENLIKQMNEHKQSIIKKIDCGITKRLESITC